MPTSPSAVMAPGRAEPKVTPGRGLQEPGNRFLADRTLVCDRCRTRTVRDTARVPWVPCGRLVWQARRDEQGPQVLLQRGLGSAFQLSQRFPGDRVVPQLFRRFLTDSVEHVHRGHVVSLSG